MRPGGSRKRCRVQFEFFQDLPDGVQQRVLTFLPASELAGSRRVCRGWRQLFSPVFNAMCMERIGNIPYTELRKQFRLLRCLQNPTVEVGSSGLLEVTRTGARLLAWACQDPGVYPSRGGGWCYGVQLRVTNLSCCVCVTVNLPFLHRLLLDIPGAANAVHKQSPLLCVATECCNIGAVHLLLLFGANVNATDNSGATAVHIAAAQNLGAITKVLLGRRALAFPSYQVGGVCGLML